MAAAREARIVASGAITGGIPAPNDQRNLGRRAYQGRAGFSPGGFSIQNDDLGNFLRYVGEISRTGTGYPPSTSGFKGVIRR